MWSQQDSCTGLAQLQQQVVDTGLQDLLQHGNLADLLEGLSCVAAQACARLFGPYPDPPTLMHHSQEHLCICNMHWPA